jgi:hypothetical protein
LQLKFSCRRAIPNPCDLAQMRAFTGSFGWVLNHVQPEAGPAFIHTYRYGCHRWSNSPQVGRAIITIWFFAHAELIMQQELFQALTPVIERISARIEKQIKDAFFAGFMAGALVILLVMCLTGQA